MEIYNKQGISTHKIQIPYKNKRKEYVPTPEMYTQLMERKERKKRN